MKKIIFILFIFIFLFSNFVYSSNSQEFKIISKHFKNKNFIPRVFTCQGKNISPELEWVNPPANTKSYVLIMDDPDAPMGTFVHWVIYNIPFSKHKLRMNFPKFNNDKILIKQGKNSTNRIGYMGPCPPKGKAHRYFFKLYALNKILNLKEGLTKGEILKKIKPFIISKTELIGLYKRL